MTPFIVLALPRSRTAWLSRFLTYGDWICGHDEIRHWRSLDDARAWFTQPCIGTAETSAAPFWRLLPPGVRIVTVRRPAEEVVDSLLRLNIGLDPDAAAVLMRRLDRKLDQIEHRLPGVLSVRFADLAAERTCAAVFEHCLPYPHDPGWWAEVAPLNMQINMRATMRHFQAYRAQFAKLALTARQQTIAAMTRRPVEETEGLTIQQEPFDKAFTDAALLASEHCVQVGELPDEYLRKNIALMQTLDKIGALQVTTARCNGRMFGYLVTIISPSLESPDLISAVHTTFFASKEFRGLGMKLQRGALDALRARGVGEVFMQAGIRGTGPKMGALFRRLGAEDSGQLFRLKLEESV